jgi:hypothetical protein
MFLLTVLYVYLVVEPYGSINQKNSSNSQPHLPALRWQYIVKPAIKARVFTTKPAKVHEEILIK